ncbi:hypothetical protein [Aquitalea sp. USM4]|uniref:hypothetical protein n=1 Tax=Aquitalea sp. USM4 TaxID=1590041 RepID=UPI0013F16230|nr:hypothetical protein [Aquitalea sp. USM4]
MNYETKQVAMQLSDNVVRHGTLYPWVTNQRGEMWVEWTPMYDGLSSGAFVEVAA